MCESSLKSAVFGYVTITEKKKSVTKIFGTIASLRYLYFSVYMLYLNEKIILLKIRE